MRGRRTQRATVDGGVWRVKVSVPTAGYDLVWFPLFAAFCTRKSSTNLDQNSYRHTRRLHYRKAAAVELDAVARALNTYRASFREKLLWD